MLETSEILTVPSNTIIVSLISNSGSLEYGSFGELQEVNDYRVLAANIEKEKKLLPMTFYQFHQKLVGSIQKQSMEQLLISLGHSLGVQAK